MREAQVSEYKHAVDDLIAAVQQFNSFETDWKTANERVKEAELRCEKARAALSDPPVTPKSSDAS